MKIELTDAEWESVLHTGEGSALPGCCIQTRTLKFLLSDYHEDPEKFEAFGNGAQDIAETIGFVFAEYHTIPSPEMVKVCQQLGFRAEVGRNVKVSKEALD